MQTLIRTLLVILAAYTFTAAQAEEVSLEHNGLTLNANLLLNEDSALDRVFLITHGTLAHNQMEIIRTWQSLLSDEGFSTLAINLSLGIDNRHGMYDCPNLHTHKHEDAAAEIAAWVNWLREKGTKEIILAAHSRGGSQTAIYSTNPAPEVIAQVLLAPQAMTATDISSSYEKQYHKPLDPLLQQAQAAPATTVLSNTDFIYCENTSVQAGSFVSYYTYSDNHNTPALLAKTTLPTLVLIGSEDSTVVGLEDKMALVGNSNVSSVVIEGADHFFRDLYMDEVIEHIQTFIEQL